MAVRYLNATGTQALINEIKSRLSSKADSSALQGLSSRIDSIVSSIPTKVSDLQNDVPFLDQTAADDLYFGKEAGQQLSIVVQQNTDAINILNADDQTEGSVDYKIAHSGGASIASISQAEIEALF